MLRRISSLFLLFSLAASGVYAANSAPSSGENAFLRQVGITPDATPVATVLAPTTTPLPIIEATPVPTPEAVETTPAAEEAAAPVELTTPTHEVTAEPAATEVPNPFATPLPPADAPMMMSTPTPTPAATAADGKDPFTEALALVYASNPQIKAQRESLKATDEGVMQALSGALPNASADYDKGRERLSVGHQKWQYGNADDKALNVRQDLFHGGETYASYKAAKDRVKAGRAQLTALEQQVLYNAVVAYSDVVEKALVLEVNQKNVDVLGRQLEATRSRFEVGDITRTDVAQSEARLAKAKSDERQALGDLDASRATYKRVVGVDAPEKLELPPLPKRLPENLHDADELALAAQPDLEALRHLEKAAQSNVDVQTSSLFPDVSLQGSMQRSSGPSSVSGLSVIDSDAIMLNVHIPLYQSGAEWSRIREAKNQASQAKFNTMDTQNAVIENVDRAWQDYHTAKAVIVSSEEGVRAADVALEGIMQENQSGLRTILDVLDTQQDAFNARLNLVRAQRAEKTQAYRLLAAVGRLTAQDLQLPVG